MLRRIIFLDSGDTLIDESTEVRDARGIVQTAAPVPGAPELLAGLRQAGYRVAMVADGEAESFENMYSLLKLDPYFEERVYSSDVGEEKPSPRMFQTAMDRMGLHDSDKPRILMMGNNLKRDIVGANRFGITSVLLDWSPRYPMRPESEEETPDFVVHSPGELLSLLHLLEGE